GRHRAVRRRAAGHGGRRLERAGHPARRQTADAPGPECPPRRPAAGQSQPVPPANPFHQRRATVSHPQRVLLGVNIDHVATLRQARGTRYPDPVQAAIEAEQAGADGITVHLREDRRHIQERDIRLLKEVMQTRMNLEIAVTDEMLAFSREIRPEHACLVPERREELTTEGGLDVAGNLARVQHAVEELSGYGCEVSLFIDAEPRQIEAARHAGAPVIELHTGHYAEATGQEQAEALRRIQEGAAYARK